jgi:uncharacterized protein (DUF433 family)
MASEKVQPVRLSETRQTSEGGKERVMGSSYSSIITIEPGKRGGKPTIRGMRITVYDVLSYLAAGMTHQEILDDFPFLREEDIRACLNYAADPEHQASMGGG